jgi:bifunctional oligoribonuclease and PAP phosphatase NrnA
MHAQIDRLLPRLSGVKVAIVTTHVNPDGDGIGSARALAEALTAAGASATIINHSTTPAIYHFLDPLNIIRAYDPARDAALIAAADTIFVVDTNQLSRLRSMEQAVRGSKAQKICIDHHLEPEQFADAYLIDDDATSTGEIIYHLLVRWRGAALTPSMATALYCAIMTDTGSFRYPRVDPDIHRIVAHLIECGADPVAIAGEVYERWSEGRIRLLGEMLAGLRLGAGGSLASVTITRAMLQRTGTQEDDTDNFTTFPMSVSGVQVGLLFLELADGVKISFRSKGKIPVNELAKEFDGNGHVNAAGALLQGATLADAVSQVTGAAERFTRHYRENP